MPRQPNVFPLRQFGAVTSLQEGTDMGMALQEARNLLLRPPGGCKGPPKYDRLWDIGSTETVQATYRALTFTGYPDGIGVDAEARAANKTCAILVKRQGKNFLLFYSLTAPESQACKGLFYLGDDDTYTSGEYDFTDGTPTFEVLAVGLDADARWYGTRAFTAHYLGNDVDDNVIVQIKRTATPGKWRKAGSNAKPGTPIISLTQPATSTNAQAQWAVTGRTGGVTLTFTADATNFPGAAGNGKIRVRIVPGAANLVSSLAGTGTTDDPYYYTLNTGTSAGSSSNNAIVTYVNEDSRVLSILKASTASSNDTPDTGSYGPTDLSSGSGSGTSDGFTNATKKVFARYWDPGQENLGYEGISSEPSNEVIITASAQNDIRVQVPIDPEAEGGRFRYIRLYLQVGESPNEDYLLVDPDNPIPNILPGPTNSHTLVDTSTDYIYSHSGTAYDTRFFPATDTLYLDGERLPKNTAIVFPPPISPATLPTGLSPWTIYYLQPTTNLLMYKVTLAPDASSTVAFSGSNVDYPQAYILTDNTLRTGDVTKVSSDGTLPAGLVADTDYYCISTTTYRTKLSLSLGGTPVNLTSEGSGTMSFVQQFKTIQIGTNTPILSASEGGSMSADQNRPLPHLYHCLVGTKLWRGGMSAYPTRLQISKDATKDELVPEGANVDSFEEVQLNDTDPGSQNITALHSDGQKLHIHTAGGLKILNQPNVDPADQTDPPVLAGALNGNCVAPWEKNQLFYLGSDLRIYRQADDNLYTKLNASSVDDAAQQYLRDRVDLTELGRKPHRAYLFADTSAKMLWYYLPAVDGTLKGYAYDFLREGLTGEFDFPKIFDLARMESSRPELVFSDEAGNLFVWDTAHQNDSGNAFPAVDAPTPHSTSDEIPVQYRGYGYVDYDHDGDGTPSRFYQASDTVLLTGYYDMGTPERRKALQALIFRTVRNSRGFVEVKLIGLGGDEVDFTYGDVGEVPRADHRADLMLTDSAIAVRLRVIGAEQKPWILRDIAALWQGQGVI